MSKINMDDWDEYEENLDMTPDEIKPRKKPHPRHLTVKNLNSTCGCTSVCYNGACPVDKKCPIAKPKYTINPVSWFAPQYYKPCVKDDDDYVPMNASYLSDDINNSGPGSGYLPPRYGGYAFPRNGGYMYPRYPQYGGGYVYPQYVPIGYKGPVQLKGINKKSTMKKNITKKKNKK